MTRSSEQQPPTTLILEGDGYDLVMMSGVLAIACGDEPPVLLQSQN